MVVSGMMFYKMIENGYITSVGTGGKGGTEVSEAEYNMILNAIHDKPSPVGEIDYRLRENLTWEAYQPEPPEPEAADLTDEEALEIILGGAI